MTSWSGAVILQACLANAGVQGRSRGATVAGGFAQAMLISVKDWPSWISYPNGLPGKSPGAAISVACTAAQPRQWRCRGIPILICTRPGVFLRISEDTPIRSWCSPDVEAAKGCGMTSFQTLIRVEMPLASPSIVVGLRMAVIYTVSWAVLAAMIGLGGLRDFIYQETTSNRGPDRCDRPGPEGRAAHSRGGARGLRLKI